jgi:hypothetical protein
MFPCKLFLLFFPHMYLQQNEQLYVNDLLQYKSILLRDTSSVYCTQDA